MTGDRVAEIRGRVEALASSEGYGYLNADKAVKANAPADLACLLAELESARAKLAAVEGVADKWGHRSPDEPCFELWDRLRAALATGEGEEGHE